MDGGFIIFIIIVVVAIVLLKGFDSISGRGPKQVEDGIKRSKQSEPERVPCPECAELILPAAKKCRFCNAELGRSSMKGE